jgi:hypothetical protein
VPDSELRIAAACKCKRLVAHPGDCLKCVALLLPVQQVRVRNGIFIPALWQRLVERGETIGFREWNRVQKRSVNDPEDGCIRANAQRQPS